MRRALIALVLVAPALVLIGWLVSAQLPRWSVPQPNWFPAKATAVCAGVDSLLLYGATRASVGGIGWEAAQKNVGDAILRYDFPDARDIYASDDGTVTDRLIEVEATLPGEQRRGYYVAADLLRTVGDGDRLQKSAVIYVDAQSGDVKALIMGVADPAVTCDFDVKAALIAAAKSPPLLLLVAYGGLTVVGLGTWWLFKRRGNHR